MQIKLKRLGKKSNLLTISKKYLKTATLEIFFRFGSSNESEGRNGLAALSRRMIPRGSRKYPDTNKLNFELEKLGATMSSSSGKETTIFSITSPQENFKRTAEIFFDLIKNPILRKTDLKKEKSMLISEIKELKDNPLELAAIEFSKQMYTSTPYENFALGKEEGIRKISSKDLIKFFSQNKEYTISLCTSDPRTNIKHLINDKNGNSETIGIPIKIVNNNPQILNFVKKDIKEIKQPVFIIGNTTPGFTSPDYYKYIILKIILGSGFGGKMNQVIREKLHIAYYAYSFFSPLKYFGIGGVMAGVLKNKLSSAVYESLNLLKEIRNGEVSSQDLKRAKGYYTGILSDFNESSAELASFYGNQFVNNERMKTIPEIISDIDKITKDEIVLTAKRYLNRVYLTLVGEESAQNEKILDQINKYNERNTS